MFDNVTCFKNKKVLITGISGFKGTWLACRLHQLGAKVFGFSLKDVPEPSMFRIVNAFSFAKYQTAEIRDYNSIKKMVNEIKPDFIFHTAAQALTKKAFQNPMDTFQINIMGTVHILESLRDFNHPCSVVLVTSDKCYENKEWIWGYRENDSIGGKDPYSASKGACEIIISSYYRTYFSNPDSKIKIASVRAGNIVGGGDWAQDRIIPDAVKSWLSNQSLIIRSSSSVRPWQHVLEPVNGYIKVAQALANNQYNGESFNFGPHMQSCVTVSELIHLFAQNWSAKLPVPYIVLDESASFPESKLLKLNCDKAAELIGWRPKLSLEQTLKMTADWYLAHQQNKDMLDFTFQQIEAYNAI